MKYKPHYKTFIFEGYNFDESAGIASFSYCFDNERRFIEQVQFDVIDHYDKATLNRALWLGFLVLGTSYYKCFPTPNVDFNERKLSPLDVELLDGAYHDGLSQFVFENGLTPEILPIFSANSKDAAENYRGKGILLLQSGGKDSLLLAEMLKSSGYQFETIYISSSDSYPSVIKTIQDRPPRVIKRMIDRQAVAAAIKDGGLNGHVPVTYISYALALIDAILHGENIVLGAVGREGAEAHEHIDDFAINHQWSKTWEAEQLLARFVAGRISSTIRIGSPLRAYSELRIAEMFVEYCWGKYGHVFSSCNVANYAQGQANKELKWCGECPKCANSFLLFAPFIEPAELTSLFDGKNLIKDLNLADTFKGLLGIDNVMKPFECVGETRELRLAYHMARDRYGADVYSLPFDVAVSDFDYRALGPRQDGLIPLM